MHALGSEKLKVPGKITHTEKSWHITFKITYSKDTDSILNTARYNRNLDTKKST